MSTAAAPQTADETLTAHRKDAFKNARNAFGVLAGGALAIGAGIFLAGMPGAILLLAGSIASVRGWADLALEGGRDRVLLDQQKNGKTEGFLDKLRKKRDGLVKKLDIAVNVSQKSFILMGVSLLTGLFVPPAAPAAFAVFKLGLVGMTLGLGASEWIKGTGECIETILGPEKIAEAPAEKAAAAAPEAPVATVASPAPGFEKAASAEKPAAITPAAEIKPAVITPAAPQ